MNAKGGISIILAALLSLCLPSPPASAQSTGRVTEQEAHEIGVEAYIYLYPLVAMDMTRKVLTNVEPGTKPGFGPANAFWSLRAFPPIGFKEVVKPNYDTLYSSAWLDLSREPMIVSAPDTDGRHYLLPMLDMWQEVFAVPGKRTSGTKAGHWAVVPPGWKGTLPAGVERIDAPTPYVWIIGRTKTNDAADYAAVSKIQDGYTVTPLSRWGKAPEPIAFKFDPTIDMKTQPIIQVNAMPPAQFFAYAIDLLAKNPPQLIDWSQLERMKRIGLERGKPFDPEKADPVVRAALVSVPGDARQIMKVARPLMGRNVNGWQINLTTWGNFANAYTPRAVVAETDIGANTPADAVYPQSLTDADGKPLQGGKRYVIRFAKGALPPVNAFWSITLYGEDLLPFPNRYNRYVVRDRDPLVFNDDGSIDLYIQPQSPG